MKGSHTQLSISNSAIKKKNSKSFSFLNDFGVPPIFCLK